MPKAKLKLRSKIRYRLTSHPWLKLIALVLAVIVWFYIQGELGK